MSKILLIDFDGVIHSYTSGWKGAAVVSDPPVRDENGVDAIGWLKGLVSNWAAAKAAGKEKFALQPMIYSSRSKDPAGLEAMKRWLLDHGASQFFLDHLEFPTQKPPAFLTLDDRAICFRGVFPTSDQVEMFRPWKTKHRTEDGPSCTVEVEEVAKAFREEIK